MSQAATEETMFDTIIKETVKAVREYDARQAEKTKKSRHDRRLRNTRLLLEHYNFFKDHIKEAVYSSSQLNAIDILDECDDKRGKTFVRAIKESTAKTYIVLKHIDLMLELYEIWCEKAGPAELRKMRVMKRFYFEQQTAFTIMAAEKISERTFYRDIDDAINRLSALIFGIDAVNRMAE